MPRPRYVHAVVTHPLIAAVITVLLSLATLVGLALPWARAVVGAGSADTGDADMMFRISGFGVVTRAFGAPAFRENWVEPTVLSIAVVLLFLALVSAVLIAFTALRRIAAVVVAATGAGFAAYAVYGLMSGMGLVDRVFDHDAEGVGEQGAALIRSVLDSIATSTGPGVFVVLVTGMLLFVFGGYVAARSGYPWLPTAARDAADR
ncbi:hypothetical protein PQI66_07565 [Corynebacterium sp. USCH3]|uniref:hypothetical protein n=1 Tax=Corynebacterium sp. USCH3 TaxID=3024840 RepID=UPI00309991B0